MNAILINPNSAPRKGNVLTKAEAEVISISDESITGPQAEQKVLFGGF